MTAKNKINKEKTMALILTAKKHKQIINGKIIIDKTLSNNNEKNNPILTISFAINILPKNTKTIYFKK